jgi:hypothetical protein
MKRDLLIIMTKYTLILAPLEVFAKRTFLGQGPETAALPDPEQMNCGPLVLDAMRGSVRNNGG